MKRIAMIIGAAAVLVTAVAVLTADPPVATKPLTITVPEGPGSQDTINLDAQLYLPDDTPAPAVIMAHGFGSDRRSLDDAARTYARDGFVVLAYSARGFGASEGLISLNAPDAEVADVTGLVDTLAGRGEVLQEAPGDPRVGIAGGSYGGGLALLAATQEPRIDAVVAAAAWHSLARSLSPNRLVRAEDAPFIPGVFKSQWASVLFTSAAVGSAGVSGDVTTNTPAIPEDPTSSDAAPTDAAPTDAAPTDVGSLTELGCGRFAVDLCTTYVAAATRGILPQDGADLLDRSSPQGRLDQVTAPTLLLAGLDDTLFGLQESLDNARGITAPVALRWIEGGHGESSRIDRQVALDWFDVHLRGADTPIPIFAWTDAASGTPQSAEQIPPSTIPSASISSAIPDDDGEDQTDFAVRQFVLAADGTLRTARQNDDNTTRSVPLIHPPGGLPASLTTLPGLGAVGGLLPSFDIPGQSIAFTSSALTNDLTLLGTPELRVPVSAPVGSAVLFVKLYDITPGGRTTLLQSAVNPVRVPPGQDGAVTVVLEPVAYRVVAGNRIRVTVSTTDQAYADGTEPSVITLGTGPDTTLVLPVTAGTRTSGIPTVLQILLPVGLVGLIAAVGLVFIGRHERHLGSSATCRTDAAPPPEEAEDPIMVTGLVKRYADGKVAVDGLDLRVGRGQVFGLLGPNGAGKTTTMRMILGLIHPTEGQIRLLGQPMRPGHPVLRRIGVLVEGPGFAPYLSGMANLRNYWLAGGQPLEEADFDRALAVADLGTAIDKPTRTYSHGMRQRLAIAQALLGDPELLILDEPTDGLDPEQIRGMRRLLARLGQEGLTVLVSSHLLSEVEQMCTHAAVVRSGKVVAAGAVADLVGSTRTMIIQTEDTSTAQTVLADLVEDVTVEGSGLVVDLGDADPSTIIVRLVQAGVRVTAATPRGRLEDAFLELTGGER